MKKIYTLVYIVFIAYLFIGCSTEPVEFERFEEVLEFLEISMPDQINSDFKLPTHSAARITWTYNDNLLDEDFIYQTPFVDELQSITAHIRINRTTHSFELPIFVLASDSARNVHTVHITMDRALNQVSRTEYNEIDIEIRGRLNDQIVDIYQTDQALIRGRGNSTWGMPKKPFRIRFIDEVSILGLPKARDYVMLAEYADKSLLRNTVVHKLSSMLEHIDHVIQTRVVELFVNGVYEGVYTLTEQVELREEKLFFETIPGVVDTGYFLELDHRFFEKGGVENVDGIVVAGQPYEIVSPNPSNNNYTAAQTAFIKQYIIDMENALSNKVGYEAYIDVDNWIDFFIVQELVKNVDVGFSSINIYKLPGGKIKLGPLWDFDLSIGNADYIDYSPYNWYGMTQYKNRWFRLMMAIPEIRQMFKDRYIEIYYDYIPKLLDSIDVMSEAMVPFAQRNFNRWQILNQYVWPNPPGMVNATTYEGQIEYLTKYFKDRSDWMLLAVQSQNFANGNF